MAAFSRGFLSLAPRAQFVCSRCLQFSTTSAAQSGHSRWSKIKHDKGTADLKKNVQRSDFSHEIALASKVGGGDVNSNPRLASVLATAKKAGLPKALMDAAVARGQGKSLTGASLEYVSLEAMMPPSVAMIIEIETDHRVRSLNDLRRIVKVHGGSITPTNYLFQKKGRVIFEQDEQGLGVDEILDDAIEAGAEDVEQDEDGNIVIWTEPSKTTTVADAMLKSHGLKVDSADIIWDPNEDTKATMKEEETTRFSDLLNALQDHPNVQGVYANLAPGDLSEDLWDSLQSRLDS